MRVSYHPEFSPDILRFERLLGKVSVNDNAIFSLPMLKCDNFID